MRILLATDGSEQSKAAVNEIAARPFPTDTSIRIVSAYERTSLLTRVEPMGVSEEFYARADHDALKAAEDATENAANILRQKKPTLTVTTIATDGSPKSVILDEAKAFRADLIVVGSHGYGMVERFWIGSVSHAVALYATCSVEIVRGARQKEEAWKILLAIDGSSQSDAAVEEIARQPFPEGSQLYVISVADLPYLPLAYPGDGPDMNVYGEIEKSYFQRATTAAENAAVQLRAGPESSKLNITTSVPSGSPKEVILEEAETFGADLIVVGSHGYGAVEGFLLGSVSQAVALHAKCSVEIVRGPKTQEE
ncbi:MAG: universal stress protein [Pyrinomonadaceae bacterium]